MISDRGPLSDDQRAVSETLGYILVFSIIVTTITTASVFGFSGLEDRQAAEQVTNVERAFDVMADNFEDMGRYEDPSRATEIRLAQGTIGIAEPITVTVGRWDAATGSFVTANTTNVTVQPLVFRSDSGSVVYEGGMVFRADGSASIARSPLPFVVDEETALVPVIATQGSTTSTVGGDQTVLVVGEHRPNTRTLSNRTVDAGGGGTQLRVRIESPRATGWERTLRDEGYQNVSVDAANGTVTAELAVAENGTVRRPDRVRLPITRIAVRFD
ncbi:hypothetical protein halTADL_0272 [Halohasta litchfieldiae]|uniref:Flagellin N-terminal-like domain-containing protein n=1 Tax=Halohasta litchfieldiae TaxID=1073996 RepID=A0A1H6YIV1_9EURY|nr:hypothetical protein [Halohasta litchfieldiae]ATW87089.1 hypothetical protein halTADL_0272 [Halohasta litchfieldiae]SEJ37140.1 hypothetical protein SAMN05444271_1602 [Halohasta litchfieldiae]